MLAMVKSMDVSGEVDGEVLAVIEEIRKEDDTTDIALRALDVEDDEGWEDLEPDVEVLTVKSLFDETVFADVRTMLQYCHDKYGFNFLKVRKEFDLDFLGTVKLVNYIRSEVQRGLPSPDVSSVQLFNSDLYLQPVLADDALLFSLGDLEDDVDSSSEACSTANSADMARLTDELKVKYESVKGKLRRLENFIKNPFSKKEEITVGFDQRRWSTTMIPTQANSVPSRPRVLPSGIPRPKVARSAARGQGKDDHYWDSYAQIQIHETMIKDKIRTEAYRDFIMVNSELFQDKVVLDVGCGSGILSMFCAQAGAKVVYAVDRSDIINQAREIVFHNKLDHIIKFRHGRIEDMDSTDIPKVDIIVSEWMGYALLYEAMLDSVLYARDNFLKPEGLLLPCQATISIAPIYDPEYSADKVTFWKDVYGFDMSALVGNRIYEEAQVRTMPQGSIVGTSHVFAKFDLYTCTKADLSFKKPFSVTVESDVPSFDGFAIWFDVAFSAEKERLSTDSSGSDPSSDTTYHFRSAGHATLHRLSTSPYSGATHWEQSYLLIGPPSRISDEHGGFTRNDQIEGEVTFAPRSDNDRALDIGVMWHSPRGDKGDQTWAMV